MTRVSLKTIMSPGRSHGREVGHPAMIEPGAQVQKTRGIPRAGGTCRDRLAREVEIEGVDPAPMTASGACLRKGPSRAARQAAGQ